MKLRLRILIFSAYWLEISPNNSDVKIEKKNYLNALSTDEHYSNMGPITC